ncbi:hypothetical protein NP233_g12123 [Leucocoprinus birnbaumii]|uniref:Uncharacterized protein n=1 Tax=Leucocoprinus birnbaumii TaxID=56174 RepID=A0AAD5VHM9_9AGAR|nr:hypothetical protein NP233_g12123 [Leucocoprinus birnbaumii]
MDPSIWNDVQIHPNVDGELFLAGAGLDDQALSLQKQGDYLGAEKVYLQALQLKLAGAGDDHITTAQTRNGLGELYIIMRKFDEAEDQLKRALAVFKAINSQTLDAPVTIENLAQVYEGKGDLQKALDTRLSGDPNRMSLAISSSQAHCRSLADTAPDWNQYIIVISSDLRGALPDTLTALPRAQFNPSHQSDYVQAEQKDDNDPSPRVCLAAEIQIGLTSSH